METVVENGHDTIGSTAARPTNASPGQRYYDTDTNALMILDESYTWVNVGTSGTISGAATVDSILGGQTTLPITGKAGSSSAGGTAGITGGQELILINNTANTITFAAAGTSNVANGTSAVIAANCCMFLVWDATSSRWYPSNL